MMLILSADHCFLLTTLTELGDCRGWMPHTHTNTHMHVNTQSDLYINILKNSMNTLACVCTLTQTYTETDTEAILSTHMHTQSCLNLATHTHRQTNCPDGIWLCNLRSVVWGSLLLNPLNAPGILASSSLYLSSTSLLQSCFLAEWTLIIRLLYL